MHTECRDCENRPKQIEKLKTAVELAKPISVILITVILIVGILALFIAGLNKENDIPWLASVNQFVSIVLGIVATIMSIISMLFSFYGLEKTDESERRQNEVLQEIIKMERETQHSTEKLARTMSSMQSPAIQKRGDIESSHGGRTDDECGDDECGDESDEV